MVKKSIMPSTDPKQRLRIAFGIGAVFVLLMLLFAFRSPKEPIYEARGLSEWVRSAEKPANRDPAILAVEMMETKSVLPAFRRYLRVGSKPERILFRALPYSFQRRFWRRRIWSLYGRKAVTLDLMPNLPRGFIPVPELLAIAKEGTEFQHLRLQALSLLGRVPATSSLEVEVEPLLEDSDAQVRTYASTCLRMIQQSQESAKRSQVVELLERRSATQDIHATLYEPLWKSDSGLIPATKPFTP